MLNINHTNIVGTLHSAGGIAAALEHQKILNMVEFRADILSSIIPVSALCDLPMPIIWTVRSSEEGGEGQWKDEERIQLYKEGLEVASLVDMELASVEKLKAVVSAVKSGDCHLILSFHDFHATPPLEKLKQIIRKGIDAGADIVKIATLTDSPDDKLRLLQIFEFADKIPLAVMGMGRFGKASRIECAQQGSVLNYAWLDRPQVPGQYSVEELAQSFKEHHIGQHQS